MTAHGIAASFAGDDTVVGVGPAGQLAHREHIAHTTRLERRLHEVCSNVWCLVGNGLSNQTFIEAPDGLIVIDTGESIQEMSSALAEVRAHSSAPIAAVIYSHFHYVSGTRALLNAGAGTDLPIWGHSKIESNLRRYGTELSAVTSRGAVHQFGMALPAEGADGLVNVGLGLSFRSADHAPFTNGFLPPTHTFDEPTTEKLAGLDVVLTPAPSDADDSITIWFPELGVCVNNLVWPALFNVFAIRGEAYRDPNVLLQGLDHILELGPEHLVGAHGPPISGAERIAEDVTDYRDSIQFLWDQTVRGINRGLSLGELTSFVQLPERFERSYLTRQFYGVAEHHVREIYTGLLGWFDGDEAALFPLPPVERCQRLIAGFGGAPAVRTQAREALDAGELRWALELASWLVRGEANARGRADAGTPEDRALLGEVLRTISQRTISANIRNWCLTRARELEGLADFEALRVHRFGESAVLNQAAEAGLHGLRVLLDPLRARGVHSEVRFEFTNGETAGLRIRDGVAVPTSGATAEIVVATDRVVWARVLAAKTSLSDAIASGAISTEAPDDVRAFFACFDHAAFQVRS